MRDDIKDASTNSIGPDFVGVGMERCGSTWISYILQQHPSILMSRKEINFFTRHYGRGMKWYNHWFYDRGDKKAGEFSPNYMISPRINSARKELYPRWNPRRKLLFWMREASARDQLKKFYPAVKVMSVFRNPVDRAWSAYWFWYSKKVRKGKATVSFNKMWEDDGRWIRSIGMYADYLSHWQELFPDMGVFFFDDIKTDPVSTVRELYKFVGVDESYVPAELGVVHKGSSYNKMPDDIREMLINYYKDQILKLADMTNRDLSSWLEQ